MHKKEYDGSVVVGGCESFKHSEKCEGCDKCTNPDISPPTHEPMNTNCDSVNPGRIIIEPKRPQVFVVKEPQGAWAPLESDDTLWGSFSGGTKGDTGKTRLDLIPTEAIEQLGRAFTHGAKEYGDHNYQEGINYSRLYGAALRHLNAYWGGEDIDEDSGLPHLALAGSEICMLMAMGSEHDDRYKRDE